MKFRHLHLDPSVTTGLNMLNNTGGLSHLPRVERIVEVGVVVDSSMKSFVQVSKAEHKARQRKTKLKRILVHLTPESFIPTWSEIARSHLEYCVQAWSPSLLNDTTNIERIQRAATRHVPGLHWSSCIIGLDCLKLCSLEHRRMRRYAIQA